MAVEKAYMRDISGRVNKRGTTRDLKVPAVTNNFPGISVLSIAGKADTQWFSRGYRHSQTAYTQNHNVASEQRNQQ